MLGTSEPVFESKDQAERMISLLLRRMNMISSMFGENSSGIEPLLYEREVKGTRFWLADDWCFGFIRAMELDHEAWDRLFEERSSASTSISTNIGILQRSLSVSPRSGEFQLISRGDFRMMIDTP
jgi:yecA family protein